MSTLDEYSIEIEETDHQHVVLIVPSLRLIVLGRTLSEARALANAAITFGGQEAGQRAPTRTVDRDHSGGRTARDAGTAQAA